VAQAALAAGVEALAVVFPSELRQLREAGINAPLFFMSSPLPEETPELVSLGAEIFVGDGETVRALAREGQKQNRRVRLHLKVDTGMARNGCPPEDAVELGGLIHQNPHLEFAGLCTHLAASGPEQEKFLDIQRDRFVQVRRALESRGCAIEICHAASSWAILSRPDLHFDMVRPGIMAYGYYPEKELRDRLDLKPVLSLRTKVVALRRLQPGTPVSYGMTWTAPAPGRLATLRIGYADGYPRLLSNKGAAVIRGRRWPVAGRVCMDHIMVFLSDAESDAASAGVQVGDEAVLIGGGAGEPTAEDLAEAAGTISYEILTGLGSRVVREYLPVQNNT
jgi:alanine racemase